jgi:adenosylhomocysteine nucleosidase
MRIAILAAMPEELAPLRAMTKETERLQIERCEVVVGRLEGREVILACTGDGAANAARGAAAVLDRFPVDAVVIVGVAGGLSPALETGRLLAASAVMEDGMPLPPPDAAWRERAVRHAEALPATFVSSRDLLCTARSKAEAYARLPRGIAAAVDLESAAFARAAADRHLPYLALRAVVDAAGETLPLDFNALRDADGAIDRRRVALRAITRPTLIAPLLRMRRRVGRCSGRLGLAVRLILAGGAA